MVMRSPTRIIFQGTINAQARIRRVEENQKKNQVKVSVFHQCEYEKTKAAEENGKKSDGQKGKWAG